MTRRERDQEHRHDRAIASAWYKRDRARRGRGYRFQIPESARRPKR